MRFLPRRSEFLFMGSILILGYVWYNALWLQPGRHPAPMFGSLADETSTLAPPIPTIRNDDYAARIQNKPDAERLELVRALQTGLRVLGHYNGDIDGLDGPMTRSAVAAYEAAQGLPSTGQANVRLLEHIRQSARVASREQEQKLVPRQPTSQPSPSHSPERDAQSEEFRLILSVQRALADLGYAPGPINGKIEQPTIDAIRRFQADRGMPITGKLTVTLVLELEAVSGVPLNRNT
ncbi:MAG: peptidoglycan-binding protein [Fimbriimonadaceae bacterium]|nr:peptidoglycan-binding protein [Alphaproteobacteria bacterium]